MAPKPPAVTREQAMEQLRAKKAELTQKKSALAKKRAGRMTFNLVMLAIVITILGVGFSMLGQYYFAMVMALGILPGLVAYATDTRKGRLASKTVVAFNIAGMLPTTTAILVSGSPDQAAFSAMHNPQTWLMVYGFSSLGWGLIFIVPHITGLYLEIRADFVVKKHEVRQKELIEEWGETVTGRAATKKPAPKPAPSPDALFE